MQSIFSHFVAREIINRFSIQLLVLTMVWICFFVVRLITHFEVISIKIIFILSVLSLITASPIIIQVAMFIAVLFTVMRSSLEHEMIVWLSSGVSLKNWFIPVSKVSAPISIIVLILSLFLSPWAYRQIDKINNIYSQESQVNLYKNSSGRFIKSSDNNFIFFAENCTNTSLVCSDVFINKITEDGYLSIIVAERVNFVINGDNSSIVMRNVDRLDMPPSISGLDSFLYHFDNYGMHFNSDNNVKNSENKLLKCSSIIDLIHDNSLSSIFHIVWRFSSFIMFLNLSFLAVPLGFINTRNGGFINSLISLLICFLYISLTNLVRSLVFYQNISSFIGVLMPHILVILFNMFLMNQILNLNSYIRSNTSFI
ncbi:lipopolysaccharide export system permease protein of the YjgP/YjgQ family [Candidatus Kinetoplastibacterium blastocrithidii TCC012E]|uniref:Lipopolysaccharide export system permease protein of the YjgP/YjgQ family n=1 Tax=Candidatus Kinetoplastidibacterium blastocrithidiae TCC012E TaxID=1208922 RepID=M1LWH2_9PROT|nr:LptF/LptG family permease [Candidatus Kinetoplastibacterium blastocrithidii]AFZ83754.1 hypothetical protein CKBE_00565 [Candidatus Kinetoplastibacterium blastocrithidii (ex Strigomonas culicis)]AGF49877.1 lipopolysaccharide export system permease protein of the YjgP/YjgQ family [Candidatus Kinetoplastibacterium blastocrithidii TCC012E]